MEPLADKLDRLASRIVSGDVVFFVGAGFSVDSERNSGGVLIARLLARMQAITESVCSSDSCPSGPQGALRQLCQELTAGLKTTFAHGGEDFQTSVQRLAQNYYLINDWMCSAFQALLHHWEALRTHADSIHRRETELLAEYHAANNLENMWMLVPIDFDRYQRLFDYADAQGSARLERAIVGKALFLDTMGFPECEVMAGEPARHGLDQVSASYRDRLKPRHFILAWLALEGLFPALLTTNYDLLMEGAYRLAGLDLLPPPKDGQSVLQWSRRLRNYTPIANATEFFSHGDGHRSTLIVKIHGCVRAYREARNEPDPQKRDSKWHASLPTMVFTFREIQNWRGDSWSRDYLQTLLRTHTVVFAGYSGSDPVIHDTFRSVYEEMARYHVATSDPADTLAESPDRAQAFFLDLVPKRDFYALEILRAASLACGVREPGLTEHPNLLPFYLTSDTKGFPRLDALMQWTFHLTYRKLQQQALENELRRAAYQLFGNPCAEKEAKKILSHFQELIEHEKEQARQFQTERELRRMTGWTVDFHRNLMREYAAADLLLRYPEKSNRLYAALRWPWYSPVNEHPEWAAWGAVLELAIRRRAAAWTNAEGNWRHGGWWVEPACSDRPAVLLSKCRDTKSVATPRRALTIELRSLRRMSCVPQASCPLEMLDPLVWLLCNETVPWWQASDLERIPDDTPGPVAIWNWAADLPVEDPSEVPANEFFGGGKYGRSAGASAA